MLTRAKLWKQQDNLSGIQKIQPMPESTTGREKQLVEISIAIICHGEQACLPIK